MFPDPTARSAARLLPVTLCSTNPSEKEEEGEKHNKMEKLKALIPAPLKQSISRTTPDDLPATCSALLEFFSSSSDFHQVVGELTDRKMGLCRKNAASALDLKRKGNECFSSGDFVDALKFYTQALRFAPMNADEIDKDFVATVYVNRATCMHKMGLLKECIRDCDRALELSPSYSKAWYRRGKANASSEGYEDAIHDLNVALSMERSLLAKNQIKNEIKTISNLCQKASGSRNTCNEENWKNSADPHQVKLYCISTPSKGRGMASSDDLSPASLVLSEEPYAAIILKHCRETHCHFCFNKLPADSVPCSLCTISMYCSERCQQQAGGKQSWNIPEELKTYITHVTLDDHSEHGVADASLFQIPEHIHECGGVHWPAILPAEVVLAGRIITKSIEKRRRSGELLKRFEDLDLCYNYVQLPSERKLDMHIYSVVLTYCLQDMYAAELPLSGLSASQLVVLLSQIKVNSMAVVHMKSSDVYGAMEGSEKEDALTCNVEQVRVGQAIYSTGSLFNHSCQPNIHAYFLSRTLFIRSTEFVPKDSPLELSYGPQVGQWDLNDRQQLLEDQYSFKCQCSGCSELTLSDLAIHAFRCVKPDCLGTVLGKFMVKRDKLEASYSQYALEFSSLERQMQVRQQLRESINEVAQLLFEQTECTLKVAPGYCLSCGSYRNLESSYSASEKAQINLKRLKDKVISRTVSKTVLLDALNSLDLLKSTMHSYSRDVAEDLYSLAVLGVSSNAPQTILGRSHINGSIYYHQSFSKGYQRKLSIESSKCLGAFVHLFGSSRDKNRDQQLSPSPI